MDLSSVEITSSRLILKSFTHLDVDEILQCITPTLTQYMSWVHLKHVKHSMTYAMYG
jgi:hypothetical protein